MTSMNDNPNLILLTRAAELGMDVIQASLEIGKTTNPKLTSVALEHMVCVKFIA